MPRRKYGKLQKVVEGPPLTIAAGAGPGSIVQSKAIPGIRREPTESGGGQTR